MQFVYLVIPPACTYDSVSVRHKFVHDQSGEDSREFHPFALTINSKAGDDESDNFGRKISMKTKRRGLSTKKAGVSARSASRKGATKSNSREIRKSVYWKEIVGKWLDSGLSKSAFCKQEKLTMSTFTIWSIALAAGLKAQMENSTHLARS